MEYRFILGSGRSGTTFLAKLLTLTNSKAKTIIEPLPGLECNERRKPLYRDWSFYHPFHSEVRGGLIAGQLESLKFSNNNLIQDEAARRVVRSDCAPDYLLMKEVHALLAFPAILDQVEHKTVVIVRDTLRVIDSYFSGHSKRQRIYLVEEYDFVKKYAGTRKRTETYRLLDEALSLLPKKVTDYFMKPKWLTSEMMRQVCITEFLKKYLEMFAGGDDRVMLVTHEDLSSDPVETVLKIYAFMQMAWSEQSIHEIRQLTSGSEKGYYDTAKNSREILKQPFKVLSERDRDKISRLLER